LSLALGPLESSSCLVSRLNIFFIYAFVPSVRISDSAVYDLTLGVVNLIIVKKSLLSCEEVLFGDDL
jgi:hypothetical protein